MKEIDKRSQTYAKRRKELGLSLKDVADAVNLSIEGYRKIETGKTKIVHKNYDLLNQTLKVDEWHFMENELNEYKNAIKKNEELEIKNRSLIQILKEEHAQREMLGKTLEELKKERNNLSNSIDILKEVIENQNRMIEDLSKRRDKEIKRFLDNAGL